MAVEHRAVRQLGWTSMGWTVLGWTVGWMAAIAVAGWTDAATGQTVTVSWQEHRTQIIQPELPALREFDRYAPQDYGIHVLLKLDRRKLYVFQGQKLVASFPVAIGRPDFPTPTGNFKVFEMITNPAWKNPRTGEVETPGIDGSLGLRWIGFLELGHGVIGFHGTPNVASIGQAASHGCVRMRNEDVVKLYDLVKIGTVVRVES